METQPAVCVYWHAVHLEGRDDWAATDQLEDEALGWIRAYSCACISICTFSRTLAHTCSILSVKELWFLTLAACCYHVGNLKINAPPADAWPFLPSTPTPMWFNGFGNGAQALIFLQTPHVVLLWVRVENHRVEVWAYRSGYNTGFVHWHSQI